MSLTPSSPLKAIQSNESQLSAWVKDFGVLEVELALINLLRQIFALTLSPVNADQLQLMAIEIRKNFWMLRFEEIMFSLNKGINSGYGKMFGHLAYPQISAWLMEYIEVDRIKAIEDHKLEKHSEIISTKKVEAENIYANVRIGIDPIQEKKPIDRNEQRLAWFLSFKSELTDEQLEAELKQCEFENIRTAIQNELNSRK